MSGATGAVTVTNSGVTSLTGTANQVIASGSTGAVTLSLPQSISLTDTPTFAKLTLTNTSSQITLGTTNIGTLTWPLTSTRTLTLPDVTDTLVGKATTDTLTNKTIAAGSNTITGLTNTNLSGSAAISNANLANSSVTVTAGTGLSGGGAVALGAAVTLTNAGVTSITGTTNQITASASTGSVTLSTPQNIHTGASPTFVGATFSGAITNTAASASNLVPLTLTQNDTTNNPNALAVNNSGTGRGILVTQTGGGEGIKVTSTTVVPTSNNALLEVSSALSRTNGGTSLILVSDTSSGSTQSLVSISSSSAGTTGTLLNLTVGSATQKGININSAVCVNREALGVFITSVYTGTGNTSGVRMEMSNASSTGNLLQLVQSGTGNSMVVNTNDLVLKGPALGIGVTSPTAAVHLLAGTTAASTAPIKMTSGTLQTTAEAGTHEYNGNHYNTNAGPLRFSVGGTLFDHFADAGNTHTDAVTFDTLYTDTTVANTLNVNGDKIRADYSGIFVSSATATREIKVLFAGTTILDSGALTTAVAESWDIDVLIIRESSTVVRCMATIWSSTVLGAGAFTDTTYTRITGLTLSGTNVLTVQAVSGATGAAANDVVAKFGTVVFSPSA